MSRPEAERLQELWDLRVALADKREHAEFTALLTALTDELAEVTKALDEFAAPVRSGGVTLSPAGRLRALRSKLVIEANRLRGDQR